MVHGTTGKWNAAEPEAEEALSEWKHHQNTLFTEQGAQGVDILAYSVCMCQTMLKVVTMVNHITAKTLVFTP